MKKRLDRKKKKIYEFKSSDNKNSDPAAITNYGKMQGKYPDDTAVIIGDIALNGIMQERLSRKGRVVKVHNFRGATVVDMKHHAILLLHKELSFVIIYAGTSHTPYLTSRKILDNLLTSKCSITDNLPKSKFVISTST